MPDAVLRHTQPPTTPPPPLPPTHTIPCRVQADVPNAALRHTQPLQHQPQWPQLQLQMMQRAEGPAASPR